jgi:trans-aconitate 2-methyltransferase
MNQVESTKHFDAIHDAYAFFLDHTTEAAQDRQAYLARLLPLARSGRPARLLDFGGGDGGFLADLLTGAGFAPDRLELAVVEPDAGYRGQAVERLAPFSSVPVAAWPELPDQEGRGFDLILSNHVLYYVPDLSGTVARIRRLLAADGLLLTTMGDRDNGFSRLVNRMYATIGLDFPHQEAEELEAVLAASGQAFRKTRVDDELRFPDTRENRVTILRFMLGDYFTRLDLDTIVAMLDAWAENGDIVLRTFHFLFAIGK